MGTNSLTNWQSNGSIQRKVRKVQSHPSFKDNSKSADGDLAVLTMGKYLNIFVISHSYFENK